MKKLAKLFLSGIVASSIMLSSVSVFANQVVRVSVGSTIANVNGNNTTLSIAPYIQKPSNSMMIPLRFVSTALGISNENIQYNPVNKQIIITYNGTTVKFIAGSTEMSINGEVFDMSMKDEETGKNTPIYTEIKNGSTFIPLRSLEAGFGVTIDWENSTKTAILTNTNTQDINNYISSANNTTNTITTSNENVANTNQTSNTLTEQDIRAMEEEVVKLVNEERAKYGLQPLEISESLMKSAREKSKDMDTKNYFSHTDPNGYNMAEDLKIAENLASGKSLSKPTGVVAGWLSSTGHRENILNPSYKYIGVGYSNNNNEYWTQHFE